MLRPEHVVVPLEAPTVGAAIRTLAGRLAASGAVQDPETLAALWDEHRIRDVIHVGDQLLLPHLRTDAVAELVMALGVSPRPLPMGEGDRNPTARVVVMVLAPPPAADRYLQTVAALARALRREATVDALVTARSPEEVLALRRLWEVPVPDRATVRDVMTPQVYQASPETPVSEVLELVARNRLHAVPVTGSEQEVLGMVTDRDLLRYLHTRLRREGEPGAEPISADTQVREIMSRSVLCISEDQSLAEVASIMINKDAERLPVVNEGRLTGFLTRGDLIRKFFGSP